MRGKPETFAISEVRLGLLLSPLPPSMNWIGVIEASIATSGIELLAHPLFQYSGGVVMEREQQTKSGWISVRLTRAPAREGMDKRSEANESGGGGKNYLSATQRLTSRRKDLRY